MKPQDFYAPDINNALPDGLRLRWLGTAGFELEYQGWVLLLDPYLTRVGLWRYLMPGPLAVNEALLQRELPRADAIVVGHSHFDHVLDVPALAAQTGAMVYGSRSTANLLRLKQVPEAQIRECVGREVFEVGPFRVTMVPSVHAEFALGHKVPYAGDIPCSCDFGGRGKDYRCGDVFGVLVEVAGCRLYHLGSANLLDEEVPKGGVDIFLMGISGRHATDRFIPRVLRRVKPRIVIPMHHDNFFRPASETLQLLPLVRFGRFVEEALAFDRQIAIKALPIGGELNKEPDTTGTLS